jgi:alpha-galactosidase
MKRFLDATVLAVSLLTAGPALAADQPLSNGLAKTPPMGWSSWNQFGEAISEKLVIETIDAMAANGLRDAGYVYVNLDDGWQHYKGSRKDHPLEADPVKFPHGIKSLADYAHGHGFKLGIYSGPGATTCAGYTGSEGHEAEDAAMFASWGIDHLKYDSCCSHKDALKTEVQRVVLRMSKALLAQSRPMVYHACHCGWSDIAEWAADMGVNHWRIGQDISDDFNYPGLREKYYFDVLDMLDHGEKFAKHAGPGHWNDFDMLIVGLHGRSGQLVGTGASDVEYRAHFGLWAMVASPLLIGADVRALDAESLATLTNKEVVAVDQDPAGHAAEKAGESPDGSLQVWSKEMADGSVVVALLNRGAATADMTVSPRRDLGEPWVRYRVRDLWKHQDAGPYDIPYTTEVMSHEAKLLRLFPLEVKP